MNPLIYGYMRVANDDTDNAVDALEKQIQNLAETEGFCYATTFFEYQDGSRAVFDELIQELKRAEARHVVVPSLEHLSSRRILRVGLVERLELDANAFVLTLDGS